MTAHAERLHEASHADRSQWAWLVGGLALGFLVPFVFADLLEVQRDVYYAIYTIATVTLIGRWLQAQGRPLSSFLLHRWPWGLAAGAAWAAVAVFAVLRVEEATGRPGGLELPAAVVWRGLVYGVVDGLLLAVFPILVVYAALEPHRRRLLGKLAVGAAALLASVAMTAVYHLGYAEFRDGDVTKPVGGSPVWSLPTLVTASPIASPIAHAAMHVTAVVHSYETDTFLPPRETATPVPELQVHLDALIAQTEVTGASAAVSTSDWTWTGAAGSADVPARRAMSPDDHFRIASVTKTYTAALVLLLVEDGSLLLDDTLERWLPGFHPRGDEITIENLLAHTSGIDDSMNTAVGGMMADAKAYLATLPPDVARRLETTAAGFVRDPTVRVSPRLWVDIAAARPLAFEPGSSYGYSNTNYVLLGMIVERATGEAFGDVLWSYVLQPLRLDDTSYVPGPALPRPFARARLTAHDPDGALFPGRSDTTEVTLGIAAASAVVATAEDVVRFYRELLGGHLLLPESLELMKRKSFGLGLYKTPCGPAYGHDGGLYGYAAFARVSADGERAAVLLDNGYQGQGVADDLLCARP
jgi:D-alanyl-D-alanine carboxypeptidase